MSEIYYLQPMYTAYMYIAHCMHTMMCNSIEEKYNKIKTLKFEIF